MVCLTILIIEVLYKLNVATTLTLITIDLLPKVVEFRQ